MKKQLYFFAVLCLTSSFGLYVQEVPTQSSYDEQLTDFAKSHGLTTQEVREMIKEHIQEQDDQSASWWKGLKGLGGKLQETAGSTWEQAKQAGKKGLGYGWEQTKALWEQLPEEFKHDWHFDPYDLTDYDLGE